MLLIFPVWCCNPIPGDQQWQESLDSSRDLFPLWETMGMKAPIHPLLPVCERGNARFTSLISSAEGALTYRRINGRRLQ